MSRFEESKIAEHDGRLDKISRDLHDLRKEKEEPEKEMTMIRVVAVEFDQRIGGGKNALGTTPDVDEPARYIGGNELHLSQFGGFVGGAKGASCLKREKCRFGAVERDQAALTSLELTHVGTNVTEQAAVLVEERLQDAPLGSKEEQARCFEVAVIDGTEVCGQNQSRCVDPEKRHRGGAEDFAER